MNVHTLVCCLEERSAGEMLNVLLPKLLPKGWRHQLIIFEGKKDLCNRLQHRIQYWQRPHSTFLVLCDQDTQDCHQLKEQLAQIVANTGKATRSKIRIACHELENFYLGDLAAVEKGLHVSGLAKLQNKRTYRTPDAITNAPEQLKKITDKTYQKCEGSRAIAQHLDLSGKNKSQSFNELLNAIRTLVAQADNP